MAVKSKRASSDAAPAPSELVLRLHAPGMGPMHRAGLGGLASTLRRIERAWSDGTLTCSGKGLAAEELPGGPWENNEPPWKVEPTKVTLHFGEKGNAEDFLKRLFALAFQVVDGLIFLPGQHRTLVVERAVLADLQLGLLLSFLQHGKARKVAKTETTEQVEVDEGQVSYTYRRCESFVHQAGWNDLTDNKGHLKRGTLNVAGPLNPGAVVRHTGFSSATGISEAIETALPLYFAIVGTLALPVNRGVGVLVVPEVDDLLHFARIRPSMTPDNPKFSRVAGASDAALQMQVRLHLDHEVELNELPGCTAMLLRTTQWATQQKSRVATSFTPPGEERRLKVFGRALQHLPPRIQARSRGDSEEAFRFDSVVRPLIADNLAAVPTRRWYEGFGDLMVRQDNNNRKLHVLIGYERKGLNAMVNDNKVASEPGEAVVVRAVHEAIRRRYGAISKENEGNPHARESRWKGEYDRWRLAFSGAKTADRFRTALCDLFARAGVNSVLQDEWLAILPMLRNEKWSYARDLALLALASYQGRGAEEAPGAEASDDQ